MNAAEWLLAGADARASEAAFVEKGARVSHAELAERAHGYAARCEAGTRVVVLATNSIDAAAALLGVMLAGATAVPLPSTDTPARIARMLERAKPAAAFADARGAKTLADVAPSLRVHALGAGMPTDGRPTASSPPPPPAAGMPTDGRPTPSSSPAPAAAGMPTDGRPTDGRPTASSPPPPPAAGMPTDGRPTASSPPAPAAAGRPTDGRPTASSSPPPPAAGMPTDGRPTPSSSPPPLAAGRPTDGRPTPALILFTSGSTGEPRGVVLSHANIIANTTQILAALPIRADDRVMAVLPFYYSFGASVLFTHVRAGACVVINNQLMFADRVLQEMQTEKCTSFAGVPGTYQLLLRRSSLPKMTFPDLRYVQQAGGRLAPTFVAELASRLPTTQIWLMYGQTEATARLTVLDPARLADKGHTIGKPIPGVTLELDADGQILARGENIALGYLDEPDATAETFRDGALHTGDIGRIDDEGFFVITDRAKDFLKCAGYRVAMKEIEDVLVAFPGTVEAAVVGIPDEIQGEAVQAFVVHPRGEEARADFDVYCKRALLPHIQPRVVVFLEALPKTAAGKLARPVLRGLVADSGDAS